MINYIQQQNNYPRKSDHTGRPCKEYIITTFDLGKTMNEFE